MGLSRYMYISLPYTLHLSVTVTATLKQVKQENCAVVLLCVLIDDTPTIDVMWIFCAFFLFMWIFVYKMCEFLLCGNHCQHVHV